MQKAEVLTIACGVFLGLAAFELLVSIYSWLMQPSSDRRSRESKD